ncbi:MAG: STAS/SEC14 domain-containing protein [Fibrobacterota bacterium]|nr:STAS/SEC14 domain-containing protein [Fibrobacterota bacterium]QQS05558.1 MAG: STAS/SEC14 domain-containing protein [Fibrobacterota bacterium]
MSIQFHHENIGKILVVQVSGMVTKGDYDIFLPEFERLVREFGKLRLLFDMTKLTGWDVGAAWEDYKFGIAHFSDIELLAMVGETRWHQDMAIFCKAFTNALVRYFDHLQVAQARQWLEETPSILPDAGKFDEQGQWSV